MNAPQPDREQAAAFLRFLDPEATKFTFQTFDDSPHKRPGVALVLHGSLDSLWDALTSLSQRGAGEFVCVNETNLRGRKACDITRVRALFADLDVPILRIPGTFRSPPAGSAAPARAGFMPTGRCTESGFTNSAIFRKGSLR